MRFESSQVLPYRVPLSISEQSSALRPMKSLGRQSSFVPLGPLSILGKIYLITTFPLVPCNCLTQDGTLANFIICFCVLSGYPKLTSLRQGVRLPDARLLVPSNCLVQDGTLANFIICLVLLRDTRSLTLSAGSQVT